MAYLYDTWDFPYMAVDEALTTDGIFKSNCLVNSLDGLANWGVIIENESIAALMAPAPLKNTLENDIPNVDGVEVYDNAKVDKRKITLSFVMVAKTQAEALTRFNNFQTELLNGRLTLKIPSVSGKYRLIYQNCTTYRPWFNGMSKIIITVVEPNPKNRT